jgi:hypothetical protein
MAQEAGGAVEANLERQIPVVEAGSIALATVATRPPPEAPARWNWKAAGVVADTIQRVLAIVGVLVAAALGLGYGLPILQAQHTRAQRDEAVAKAEIARREATEKQILDLDLSAAVLSRPGAERYVVVSLEVKNTGNRTLSFKAEDLRGAITAVNGIDGGGHVRYGEKAPIRFGQYPDVALVELKISPGERTKLQGVQQVGSEGLKLVTTEISLGGDDAGGEAFRAILFTQVD